MLLERKEEEERWIQKAKLLKNVFIIFYYYIQLYN